MVLFFMNMVVCLMMAVVSYLRFKEDFGKDPLPKMVVVWLPMFIMWSVLFILNALKFIGN